MRRFGIDPAADAAKYAVGGNHCAYSGAESAKGRAKARPLHDRLDLGPAPVVIAQRRKGDLGIPRFTVAHDQQPNSGEAIVLHATAQDDS